MNRKKEKKKSMSSYAYYSGMGVQMLVTIGLFAFLGYKLDERAGRKPGLATGLMSCLGVFLSLFYVIRSLYKKQK